MSQYKCFNMATYNCKPTKTKRQQFECCGITVRPARGYELWKKENAHFRSDTGPVVPESCCRSREDDPVRKACLSRQPRREDTYYEVSEGTQPDKLATLFFFRCASDRMSELSGYALWCVRCGTRVVGAPDDEPKVR